MLNLLIIAKINLSLRDHGTFDAKKLQLRKLISPSAAELYALFREKRYMLMKSKKIKTQDAFFFYRMEHLKEDLVKPNSTNTVKKLLDDLIEYNLIETQI